MSSITIKNDPLLTLRAFACVLVLLGHGIGIAFAPKNLSVLARDGNVWWLTSSPWAGVWVFFVLSGYLIGKGFFKKRYLPDFQGIKNFYHNRVVRILPLYWISVIVIGVLVTPQIFSKVHALDFLKIMGFIYDGHHRINPIGALWSVSTEMNFYLVAPFIFLILQNVKSKKAVFFSLLSTLFVGLAMRNGCWSFLGDANSWKFDFYTALITNLDLFIFGMLLNPLISFYQERGLSITFPREKGLILMAFFYFLVTYISKYAMIIYDGPMQYYLLCWVPTLTAIVMGGVIFLFEFARSQNEPQSGLAHAIISKTQTLGLLTYALYVWHEPVFNYFNHHLPASSSMWTSLWQWTLSIVVCVIIAWISHELIEKRFEKKKKLNRS